jgi:hypothetical protein
MSFGGLFDGGGGGGMNFPYAGAFSSSPALSLGLVRVPSSTTPVSSLRFLRLPWRVCDSD